MSSAGRIAAGCVAAALLAACQTAPMRRAPVVVTNHYTMPEAPPAPMAPPAPVPNPIYKVGEPYEIAGNWYYPHEQADYDETGIASWYGADFHGNLTADGEIFDRNGVTAAHTTLPMPVNVRVTNLENGRSLVVRVNDRGPFVNGRVIDLSEHAADLLGFRTAGLARVRVTYLGRADLYGPGLAPPSQETPPEIANAVPAAPVEMVELSTLPPVAGARVAPPPTSVAMLPRQIERIEVAPLEAVADGKVTEVPVPPVTAIFVQAGAFTSAVNAGAVAARLQFTGARVYPGRKDGKPIYRVRIGPFQDVSAADAILAQVQALGHSDAQIVVEGATS
jgi:rare lipoprotein A